MPRQNNPLLGGSSPSLRKARPSTHSEPEPFRFWRDLMGKTRDFSGEAAKHQKTAKASQPLRVTGAFTYRPFSYRWGSKSTPPDQFRLLPVGAVFALVVPGV